MSNAKSVCRYLVAIAFLFLLSACQTPQKSVPVFSDAEVQRMVSLMEQSELEGRTLSAKQIKAFFEGTNVRGISRFGERIGFSLSKEGDKMFELLASFYDENGNVIRKDAGFWWTAGDKKLCGKLKSYDRYRSHCFIVGWKEDEYFLTDIREEQVYWFKIVSLYDPSGSAKPNASKSSRASDKEPGEYHVGRIIGYSEVCSEFRGIAADPQILQTIKQLFGANPDFKRGYAEFDNFTGFDFVTGLTECEQVKAGVEKIYNAIKATVG